ncbi:MAG TPA: hypothetical protein VE619_01615, partial [Nitrososphaeraceae archaeon]|nr:hypothetical protein [Nitrososphaeraceae archaeon]
MTASGKRNKEDDEQDSDKGTNNSVKYRKDMLNKLSHFLRKGFFVKSLGPGIITGAADEDPS